MAYCRIDYLPVAWITLLPSSDASEVTPVSPFPLGRPSSADTTRGGFNPMLRGAWLMLRPHQPGLLIRLNPG